MLLQNPLTYFIFGLLFAWVASYFYSAWHNRRKLTITARWLEDGLHILGSKISSRWKGTDRLDIMIGEGRGVISEVAIVLAVQSRRLFNALISLLRGGRDSISFLVRLSRNPEPAAYFEIFALKEPLPRTVALEPHAWQIEDYPRGAPYRVAFKTEAARESAFRLVALLHDLQLDIRRISIRPSVPQVFFLFNLTQLPQSDPNELLRLIRNVAEEVTTSSIRSKEPDKPGAGKDRPPAKSKSKDKLSGLPPRYTRPGLDSGLSRNGHHSPNGKTPHE